MQILSKNAIQLCCKAGSCPIITLNDSKIKIFDDFGREVEIKLEEAEMIADALKVLKNNQNA